MDITKFFDRRKRALSHHSADGDDSKRPLKKTQKQHQYHSISW